MQYFVCDGIFPPQEPCFTLSDSVVRGVGCGLLSPMVWVLISALTYCVVLAPLLKSLGLSPLRAKTG